MMGLWNLSALHAPLAVGLSGSKCSPVSVGQGLFSSHGAKPHTPYLGYAGFRAAKIARRIPSLSTLPLLYRKGIWGLCPHVHSLSLTFCPANQNCSCPFSLLHPNDRAAEIAVAICGAENQPARGQMLSRAVPAAHVFPANCIPIIIQGVWGPAPMAKNGP
jgi:hypothetical protein